MAARRHHPADLHWKPAPQARADSPVYGGGIQYGQRFKHAFSKLPEGWQHMWMTLHWDGTFGRGLEVTPIATGVANINNCDKSKESNIGYIPFTPDQRSPRFKVTAKCTRLKFYIRQQCAAAILRVMESAATTGVLCRLKNVRGEETTRLLFPKLASMNFDQPEAQLFFGHQNKETCSHCRRRRGRNAFRRNAPQIGTVVHRLYDIATGGASEFREEARQKLKRWGFNFARRCCVPKVCPKLLVRMPGRDEVFPGLDFRDTLHGIIMFLMRQFIQTMEYIPFTPDQRRVLDVRLALLASNRHFRDPMGNLYRSQRSIFSETGMTGHDRIQLLFLLPHIFGPVADATLPDPELHLPLMTAVARAQLIVISTRGLRCYTQSELRDIFDRGYLEMFGSLQRVWQISYLLRLQRHERFPRQYKRPSHPFERPEKDPAATETDDTDEEFNLGGFTFSHGPLCLIHQHWVEQVISAGGFNVHCTQSSEAAHKTSAKLTASRVRHFHGMKTVHSMTTYLCAWTVFEHLKDFFPDPPSNGPACPITYGVKVLLTNGAEGDSLMTAHGGSFSTPRFQSQLLHKEIPVTRVEFMDMLCDQFLLSKSTQTYRCFERLSYKFGQKFTTSAGENLWATDTQYTYSNVFNQKLRRDRFLIEGVVQQSYRLADGRRVERTNALCAEVTCFLTVDNLSQLDIPALDPARGPERKELRESVHDDSVTFFLVRWLEPHLSSLERDQLHRPICPGPLHINHCLWTYARTESARRSVPANWPAHERFAYYGLIFPQNVVSRVNISPCFLHGSTNAGVDWLETVTLI